MLDIITPAEAFRLMLAARYGKATLKFAGQITDYGWFWYPESPHLKVRKGKVSKLVKIPPVVHEAMDRIWKLLRDHVRKGDIGLRGELNNNPPIDIDRADCLVGEFNIFDQTLTIPGQGGKPARIYRRVFCVKDNVMRIINSMLKNRSATTPITLEETPEPTIRDVIRSVYDDADKGGPRPNINELPEAVQPRIEKRYKLPSGRQIKAIGGESEFRKRRGKVGKRLT